MYFKETRCYPPQHVVLIRRTVCSGTPDGRRIVDAFQRADEVYHASQRLYPYGSPWLIEEIEQTDIRWARVTTRTASRPTGTRWTFFARAPGAMA